MGDPKESAAAAAKAAAEKAKLAEIAEQQQEVDDALGELPSLRQRVEGIENKAGLVDPDFDPAIFQTEKTAKGDPTTGPQRLTISVPFESTYLNLGAASWDNLNEGISGHTDEDIFFFAKTPSTKVELGGRAGGYKLTTAKKAWHFSYKNHDIITNLGTLTVEASNGGTAALVSAPGIAEVNGGAEVRVRAGERIFIHGAAVDPEQPTRASDWQNTAHEETGGILHSMLASAIGLATAGLGWVGARGGSFSVPVKMASGETTHSLGAGPFASAVATGLAGLGPLMSSKSVHINATNAAAAGNMFGGMWGIMSSTISGLLCSSLMAPFADVTGFAHAGLFGGKSAGVSAIGRVLITSTHGPTVMNSKTATSIAGGTSVSVGSKGGTAQLSSHTARAAVYGKSEASLMSPGFGIAAVAGKVIMGKRTASDLFSAEIDPDNFLEVTEDAVNVKMGKGRLELTKNRTFIGEDSGNLILDTKTYALISGGKPIKFG